MLSHRGRKREYIIQFVSKGQHFYIAKSVDPVTIFFYSLLSISLLDIFTLSTAKEQFGFLSALKELS